MPWRTFLTTGQHKLASLWHRSQIGHRSEYSVERLLAFRDYYERTSLAHAVLVCMVSPLPAFLVALAIDCIPLRPPSEGWKANYAVWIRLLLAIFVEAIAVAFQVRAVIIPGTLSKTGASVIALGTAICSVLLTMAVAEMWKFPIPYGYVIMLNFYVLFFMVGMILVIGPRVLLTSCPVLRQQIKAELLVMANQSGVAVLYPVFSAVFNHLSGIYQPLFVLIMPLIKFATKQNIAYSAQSFHEYVGPLLVFSVDLFNIYYVAICMQNSKSLVTTLIIMSLDGFHVILALRTIFHRSNSVQTRQQTSVTHYLRDLPAFIREEFKKDSSYSCDRRIRLLAPFSLPLSAESKALIDELVRTDCCTNDTSHCGAKPPAKNCLQNGPILVKPSQVAPVKSSLVRRSSSTTDLSHANVGFVREALQTLFHSEYVLLAEYIEFMVPMLYALYLRILFHLEVAAYYPHTATMTVSKLKTTVMNILIYASLEGLSLAALFLLLKRKFGFSPVYQIAFVLESQASAIQGHLFLWTISILHITLVHYGADFMVQSS